MLELSDIKFRYLKGEYFQFSYKFDLLTPVVIQGASGSGKSTLLNIIAGLISPSSGYLRFEDNDLLKLSPSERPLSVLFQSGNLFDHISCLRNVEIGLNMRSRINSEEQFIIEEVFQNLGISDHKNVLPTEISGGQRKRIALARAIVRAKCLGKKLMLLDEPFNGLDFETKSECINLLKDGCFKEGYKVIIVSHDNNDPTLLGAKRVKLENILK